ncbi:hypothetical protein BKA57DRAFT_501388 [Linnemannia elongata]|nr:hypothetical protein BKA57DRAFT_501388 [Linnemannia elongata]
MRDNRSNKRDNRPNLRDDRSNMRDDRTKKTKTVFCVVEGETSMSAFPVTFGEKDFIADIKNLIKAAKTPMFDHFPATELTLYCVSCPFSSLGDLFMKFTRTSQPQLRDLVHPMMPAYYRFVGSDTSTSIIEIFVEPPQTTAELI